MRGSLPRIFLSKFFVVSDFILKFAATRSNPKGREGHNIDGILRPTKPFVGQVVGKGVYGRYCSVLSNFAT